MPAPRLVRLPVVDELRRGERFLLTTHEGPDGDALGSLLAHARDPRPARQGLGDVPGREGVSAAGRVPLPAARGGLPRAPRRRRRPHARLPRLRQHRPDAGRLPAARRRPHHQHRPPPRQHPLRHRQPRRHRGLVHGGDRLRPRELLGAEITPEIAAALYVGLVTDTGRFIYENTGSAATGWRPS